MDHCYAKIYTLILEEYYHLSIELLILTYIEDNANTQYLSLKLLFKLWQHLNYERIELIEIIRQNKGIELDLINIESINGMDFKHDINDNILEWYFKIDQLINILKPTIYTPIKLKLRHSKRKHKEFYRQVHEDNYNKQSMTINSEVIFQDDIQGNTIVATKFIKPGEIVYKDNQAIVWCLNAHYKRNHCYFCLSKVGRNRQFCNNKCKVVYCSNECKLQDFKLQHNELCQLGINEEWLKFNNFQEMVLCLAAQCISKGFKGKLINFGNLPYLHCPSDYFNNIWDDDFSNKYFIGYLKEYLFIKKYFNSIKWNIIDLNTYIQLVLILKCNIMNLNSNNVNELGSALFFLASMVNHACNSNSKFVIEGKSVSIVARNNLIDPIQPNQEITISYFPVGEMPLNMRKKYFLETYGFECRCNKCIGDSKMDNQIVQSSNLSSIPRFFDMSTLFDE